MTQGLGPNLERDMPVCCLVAFGVLAWEQPDRQFSRDTRHQPCSPAAICGSQHRKARPDILSRSGECSRPYAEARTPGRAYDILRSKGESFGGATLDNEENYLIKRLFTGGLGILSIENQARL
jgi:hypothetical protein